MTLPRTEIDPDGLLEYSVVFTDRSLNHMSKRFVGVMQDIIDVLRTTYSAPPWPSSPVAAPTRWKRSPDS